MFNAPRNSGTVLGADAIAARRLEFTLRRQGRFRAGLAVQAAAAAEAEAQLSAELAADLDWRTSYEGRAEAVADMLAVPMDDRTRRIAEEILREDLAAEAHAASLADNPFLAHYAVPGA
jgi:hypothetical protein